MSEQWKIHQLQQIVALALSNGDASVQPSARVRDIPDTRTIRYYTTLGLIDRPVEMKGRTAYYDRRHVVQLVAIKRLQQDGLSLAGIQERLVGSSKASVRRIAKIPTEFWHQEFKEETVKQKAAEKNTKRASAESDTSKLSGKRENDRSENFWTTSPAPPSAKVANKSNANLSNVIPNQRHAAKIAIRLAVADGAVLEIDTNNLASLDEVDLSSLQPFITALAEELKRQGLAGE